MPVQVNSASFRDPSGFIFKRDGILYRQINKSYAPTYQKLMDSGLYQTLVDQDLMISHVEVDKSLAVSDDVALVIQPTPLKFISYPYEWSFSQLKIAALTTLKIQKIALDHGFILKDSSAYNLQFIDRKAVLIDTLSFVEYTEGEIWQGYRQFCQHFLAPLALMSYTDVRLNQLLQTFIDGVPLDLASSILPLRSRLKLSLLVHVFLHARVQKRYKKQALTEPNKQKTTSRRSMDGLIDNLEQGIRSLSWKPEGDWTYYYDGDSYVSSAFEQKKQLVSTYIDEINPSMVWDMGANTGEFSRIASSKGIFTVSWDLDPGAVELNYREVRKEKETHLLPLVLDLANPSPSIGWSNQERMNLTERGSVDLLMALALIHHLAIGNNVPLDHVAKFFAQLGESLIIEFVPKQDPKVQLLLSAREDIFSAYTEDGFIKVFNQYFDIMRRNAIQDSQRILFLMKKK